MSAGYRGAGDSSRSAGAGRRPGGHTRLLVCLHRPDPCLPCSRILTASLALTRTRVWGPTLPELCGEAPCKVRMLARGEGGAFGFISGAEGTGVQSCWRSRCKSLQLPRPRQRRSAVAAQSPRLCAREARALRGPGVSLLGLAQHCRRGRRAGLTFQFFCMRLSVSF